MKALDEIFRTLPPQTLAQLPTPRAFRSLDEPLAARFRTVYYSTSLDFESKLRALEQLMSKLPAEAVSKIPLQASEYAASHSYRGCCRLICLDSSSLMFKVSGGHVSVNTTAYSATSIHWPH